MVGPSGCGKTHAARADLRPADSERGHRECAPAALMPQRDLLLPWLSALDNAALALRLAGAPRAQARARAGELFAELGLRASSRPTPHELSGGMRQRVAFLRTLLSGKPLLCLDEPFGALDAITRPEMQDWLGRALEREPRTVVLVTHDVEEAVVLADRIVVLSPRPGRIVRSSRWTSPAPGCAPIRGARAARAGARRAGRWSGSVRRRARQRRYRRSCSCCALLGAWEAYVDSRRRRAPDAARAPRSRSRAVEQRRLFGHNLAITAEEVALGLALALLVRLCARRSRSTSRRCCAAPSTRWRSAHRRSRSQ